ncbi:MAG: hypothetical protein AB7K41_16555 [Bdellovibrionales bacterium]
MDMSGNQVDSRRQGWWLVTSMGVAALLLLSTSQSWALDLDREIARREADAAQIQTTLGRPKKLAKAQELPSLEVDDEDDYKIEVLPKDVARR